MPTLKVLPSGTIDIELRDDNLNVLQFNCGCTDAFPFCHAACCRNRGHYAAVLESDELKKYNYMWRFTTEGMKPVVASQDDGTCWYLTKDNKCSVHEDKPKICGRWHCSPGGKGEIKDQGWILSSAMEAK